jgi:hypothetical protein
MLFISHPTIRCYIKLIMNVTLNNHYEKTSKCRMITWTGKGVKENSHKCTPSNARLAGQILHCHGRLSFIYLVANEEKIIMYPAIKIWIFLVKSKCSARGFEKRLLLTYIRSRYLPWTNEILKFDLSFNSQWYYDTNVTLLTPVVTCISDWDQVRIGNWIY